MDQLKAKRRKLEQNDSEIEALNPLSIFPDMVWHLILEHLHNGKDYHNISQSAPDFHDLLSRHGTKALFGDVIKVMVYFLENGQDNPYLDLPNLARLRRICRAWKIGVNSALENLSYNYKFSHEHKLPTSQFLKHMDHKYGYRFASPEESERFDTHFMSSHGDTNENPFITRRIIVTLPNYPDFIFGPHVSAIKEMLRKFGKHVWYLHFECGFRNGGSDDASEFLIELIYMLWRLPNLRVLRFEPSLNRRVRYRVHQFKESASETRVPQIPFIDVEYSNPRLTEYTTGNFKPEPEVIVVQTEDRNEAGLVQNPARQLNPANLLPRPPMMRQPEQSGPYAAHLARLSNLIAQTRKELERRRTPPVFANRSFDTCGAPNTRRVRHSVSQGVFTRTMPKMPNLRYIDQGDLPYDRFWDIVQPNMLTLTQLGTTLASSLEFQTLFELSLPRLTKLGINLSNSGMQWSEIFKSLESRVGKTLQNLHIWLPKPASLQIDCQLKLPNLQVLQLLLDNPIPLDFLLGVSSHLQELHIKIRRMNRRESVSVQRAEQAILFYQHLDELTRSNIWSLFPKLKCVRVSSHVEIANLTPLWECTRDQWKSQDR